MAVDKESPRVVVLRCRACRAGLPAASHDVAFRCPQCGRGWEIDATGLSERRSYFVTPPPASKQPILYLPYWSFRASSRAKPSDRMAEAQLTARDRAARIQRTFVSAYAIYRPTYVGEWGLNYTRIQPDWEPRSGHGPEVCGAAIPSAEAKKIARHYVLGEIDRAADLGSLEVTLQLGEPELWALPSYDLGRYLRCPWTRAELPAAALDDLSQIRRTKGKLEA